MKLTISQPYLINFRMIQDTGQVIHRQYETWVKGKVVALPKAMLEKAKHRGTITLNVYYPKRPTKL